MEITIEIGQKFGKGNKSLFGVKLNEVLKRFDESIEKVFINEKNELEIEVKKQYIFKNGLRNISFFEGKIIFDVETAFFNLSSVEVKEELLQEEIFNEESIEDIEKRLAENIISENAVSILEIKNYLLNLRSKSVDYKSNIEQVCIYQNLINDIKSLLLKFDQNINFEYMPIIQEEKQKESLLSQFINHVPKNLQAKKKNAEKRKQIFVEKFKEGFYKLQQQGIEKPSLNQILKISKLNKQTYYNYLLDTDNPILDELYV